MTTITLPKDFPLITPFGTNTIELGVCAVDNVPVQIIGLVPCRPDDDECVQNPCETICAIQGEISAFLFEFPDDTPGSDDFRIEKFENNIWTEIVTGNPLNTLSAESGVKFTFGSFASQPLYSGFEIRWGLIFTAEGAGTYRFIVVPGSTPQWDIATAYALDDEVKYNGRKYKALGNTTGDQPDTSPGDWEQITSTILMSFPFNLKADTCENKEKTVRLEIDSIGQFPNFEHTTDNGKKQFFDLIDETWSDAIRYPARIVAMAPERETTTIVRSDQTNLLHRDEQILKYSLKIFRTTYELLHRMEIYGFNSRNIKISDGNTDNVFNFNQINVVSEEQLEFEEQRVTNQFLFGVSLELRSEKDQPFSQC